MKIASTLNRWQINALTLRALHQLHRFNCRKWYFLQSCSAYERRIIHFDYLAYKRYTFPGLSCLLQDLVCHNLYKPQRYSNPGNRWSIYHPDPNRGVHHLLLNLKNPLCLICLFVSKQRAVSKSHEHHIMKISENFQNVLMFVVRHFRFSNIL